MFQVQQEVSNFAVNPRPHRARVYGEIAKSTLSRAVAVAFAENDWSVHLADMDWQQQTCGKWTARRDDKKLVASLQAQFGESPLLWLPECLKRLKQQGA